MLCPLHAIPVSLTPCLRIPTGRRRVLRRLHAHARTLPVPTLWSGAMLRQPVKNYRLARTEKSTFGALATDPASQQ